MSRLFEALRKSEEEAGRRSFDSPEAFFASINNKQSLLVGEEKLLIRPENHIVVYTDPHSPGSEQFRLLRSCLRELQSGGKLKVLLVTSALRSEGKSTIATNLATVLADQGKRKVLLLEADLRCPSFARQWGLKPWQGLAESLEGDSDPLLSVRRIEPLGIYLLPGGVRAAEVSEHLPSEKCAELMQSLAPHFEWIIIDSPPVIPMADTLALKQTVDAILFVVRAGHTPREAVEEAINQFPPGQVIGVILNAAEKLDGLYPGYYRPSEPESSVQN